MRVTQPLEREGFFWFPESPEEKVPGTLRVRDGGEVGLDLLGILGGTSRTLSIDHVPRRIVGHVDKEGDVTLDGCLVLSQNISMMKLSRTTYYAHRLYLGASFDEESDIALSGITFSVEHLDEWVGLFGIDVNYNLPERSLTIGYKAPDEVAIDLRTGLELKIGFSSSWPSSKCLREATVTQKAYITISPKEPTNVDDLLHVAHNLASFLCLGIGETVELDELIGLLPNAGSSSSDEPPPHVRVFYESLPTSRHRETHPTRYDMLFTLAEVRDNAHTLISNWLDAYDTVGPSLHLFFAATSPSVGFSDAKFLSLVQGLESYHRRTSDQRRMDADLFERLLQSFLEVCPSEHKDFIEEKLKYANEPTLGSRLKDLIEPYKSYFGNNRIREKFVYDVVNTRNYMTHYDKSLESKACSGAKLVVLIDRLELLYQLTLFRVVGFSDGDIEPLFKPGGLLRRKQHLA